MRWRALQNALIVGALSALFSQNAFAQLPGTFLAPGVQSAGVAAILDCIGGTVTYSGGNTIHKFTTVGSTDFYCPTQRTVNYLLVAGGGGGGGTSYSGGGGAGGMLTGSGTINVGTGAVIVGAGGAAGAAGARGTQGSNSLITTPGGAGSFTALIPSQTPVAFGSGFSLYELRTRFTTPLYLAPAPTTANQIRVSLGGAAGQTFISAFCGHAGGTGTSLNYDGSQVQIKWGGNANITVPAAASPTASDATNFTFDKTKDLICSFNWSYTSISGGSGYASTIVGGGVSGNSNAGNTTTTATGAAGSLYGPITLIEVLSNQTIVASATGGGGGGSYSSFVQGGTGGSSGGGSYGSTSAVAGTAGQGNAGGFYATGGSGGGGAGAVGANGTSTQAGNGGAGLASTITGASVIYAAGGAGGAYSGQAAGTGGSSIGGNGGAYSAGTCTNGAANTGSGGGGISSTGSACNGGSGVVVISYPSGAPNVNCIGGTVTTIGANTVHSFTTPGSATLTCVTGKAINYLVVAGGGWGGTTAGSSTGGGGGAGGVLTGTAAYVAPGPTTITVGAGAAVPPAVYTSCTTGTGGSSSILGIASATGGGNGACSSQPSSNGGSGGGSSNGAAVGTGIAGQGNNGGSSFTSGGWGSGGGGGCGAVGTAGTNTAGGTGGAGCSSTITGTSVCYAGGGAGGLTGTGTRGTATCGGGQGGLSGTSATAGAANTGGGGGGQGSATSTAATGTAGGSGIVVASYVTDSTQAPPAGTWRALISTQTPASLGTGWTTYHLRTRYNTSAYVAGVANSGNTQIRVSVTGGGVTGNAITAMWCGHAAAADPSLDFDGSQVQIRFSGNANINLPSGTVVSDAVNYSFDKTKALICSFNWGSNTVVSTSSASAGINSGGAAGAGANAGVNAAGFAVGNNNYDWVTTLIEVFGP
jgi:Glycine-rich domain